MERCKTTKEREGVFRRTLVTVVALGTILSADVAFAYTSADYVQSGLIGQWDGIENAGVGIHSGTTNIWKDLVGDCDLTLTANGSWSDGGDALIVSGYSAAADAPAPEYKTIEIVYRMTTAGGRILFSRGGEVVKVRHTGEIPRGATRLVPGDLPEWVKSLETPDGGAVVSQIVNGDVEYVVVVNRSPDTELTLRIGLADGVRRVRADGSIASAALYSSEYWLEPGAMEVFGKKTR